MAKNDVVESEDAVQIGGGHDVQADLMRGVYYALQRYSNVHRGTGHHSIISTELFERARQVVREHLGLGADHVVLFLSPWKLVLLRASLKPDTRIHVVSSNELQLALGVRAVAIPRLELPRGVPYQTGGGTVKLVSDDFISWEDAPDRFEPGTPNIIGSIALARALLIGSAKGPRVFADRLPGTAGVEDILYRDSLAGLSGKALLEGLCSMFVGRGAMVDTIAGKVGYVHLDNGASTPTFEPIWDAFRNTLDATPAVQADVVRQSSKLCGEYFGAPEQDFDVLFTANTTEGVNIAVQNLAITARELPGTVVMNTLIEHNSNELPWRFCPDVEHVRAPVDSNGFIDLVAMEEVLAAYNERREHGERRIRLVCVCGASNVMGTYSDIPTIGRLVRRYGAHLLVDAAQLSAHRAIDMARDNVDFLTFSAHKMYAPFGSGGLVARRELLQIDKDDLAFIRQSGVENAAGIAALGKAVNLLSRIGFDALIEHEVRLTRRVLDGLATIPGVKVYGISDPDHAAFSRKGGLVCFEVGHIPHNRVARQLAEQGGIGVRSGCFCVNLYVKEQLGIGWAKDAVAHVGLSIAPSLMQPLLLGLVRVSLGIFNTEADVDRLIDVLRQIDASRSSLFDKMLAGLHFGTFDSTQTEVSRRVDDSVGEIAQRVYFEGVS